MSLVLRPDSDFEEAVNITSYAAVCIVRTIRELAGKCCGIKWVNDVFLDGRKICGILTEAVADFESGTVTAIIVGIGINLRPSAVPEELSGIVGFLDCGMAIKNRLVAGICDGLLHFDGRDTEYMEDYRKYSVVLGKRVTYVRDGERKSGLAADIDGRGGLVVRFSDGTSETLRSGEISLSGIEGIK